MTLPKLSPVPGAGRLGIQFLLAVALLSPVAAQNGSPPQETLADPEVTVFSGEAVTGDEEPVTRERILATLRGNQDQALLAGLVSQYGIAFACTPELTAEFRNAGANEILLAEIAKAKVTLVPADAGIVPLPLAKARDYDGSDQAGRLDIRLYVDGAAEVRVQNNTAFYKTLQGREPRNAGTEITGIFPAKPFKKLDVTKKDGRGSFVLIERPSAGNGFRMVLRIYDPKAGENRYHLRIEWRTE